MRSLQILFASWHFYLDSSNGASISVRELLQALCNRRWRAETLGLDRRFSSSRSGQRTDRKELGMRVSWLDYSGTTLQDWRVSSNKQN